MSHSPFHVLSLIASSNSLCIAGTSHRVGWAYGAGQDLAAQGGGEDIQGYIYRWISGDTEVYVGVQRDTERYRGMRMQMDKWGYRSKCRYRRMYGPMGHIGR